MRKKRVLAIALILQLVATFLSGCFSSGALDTATLRLGDHVGYKDRRGTGHYFSIESIGTVREPKGGWCEKGIHARQWTISGTEGDSPPGGFTICPPGSNRGYNLQLRVGHQDQMEHIVIQRYGNLDQLPLICAMLAAEESIHEVSFNHSDPRATADVRIILGEDGRTCDSWVAMKGIGGGARFQFWQNVTAKMGEGPYPISLHGEIVQFSGKLRQIGHFEWKQVVFDPGNGQAWEGGDFGNGKTIPAEPWDDRPTEDRSPFGFPMDDALAILALDTDYQEYRLANPEAFLGAASYAVSVNTTTDQTEFLWMFYWIDGTNAFWALCHLLRSPVSELPVVAPYEEMDCWDTREVKSVKSHHRTMHSPMALSWEQAARTWRDYVGADVEIGTAAWVTVGENEFPTHTSLTALQNGAPNDPYFFFNYYPGTLATTPHSPSWKAQPVQKSHAWPAAPTLLDAETGVPMSFTAPTPPPWLLLADGSA